MKTQAQQSFVASLGDIPGVQITECASQLPAIDIRNRHGSGRILLQGALLLEWTPSKQEPVVWLSPNAKFAAGKAPRGGVPICWPWFGPHDTQTDYPAHGIARTANWELTDAQHTDDGAHRLTFMLIRDASNSAFWSHDTPLTLRYTLGPALEIELITRNQSPHPVTISEALHTYFGVGDIRQVRIHGLDGSDYIDKVAHGQRFRQSGDVTFSGETDRVYLGTTAHCIIEDPVLLRSIRIEKQGSRSTVVWNPWAEKAEKMGDYIENGYLNMVCVESGNALDDRITLAPGEEHRLWARYSVTSLN